MIGPPVIFICFLIVIIFYFLFGVFLGIRLERWEWKNGNRDKEEG